jgi:2-amino-4-hydroxy-6-hydroxymethyldihydropteridine diphosphokinase
MAKRRHAATAYVGLGANLGRREETLRAALAELGRRPGVRVVRASAFRETEPVGGPPGQPCYLNAAAELLTTLEPEELLTVLQQVEDAFGRTRQVRWGPRTLDLDLLLYEDRVIDTPALQVPHARMHERRFVLEPLCEVAPEAVHPVLGKTVRQMLEELG